MEINFIAVLVAAIVPMALGFIWYNPKVFGNAWMQASGLNEEKLKNANMAVIFGVSFILSFLLAFFSQALVIHKFHVSAAFFDYRKQIKDFSTTEGALFKQVMDLIGTSHRTFKHGAFHGILSGLFIVMPIIATNAMFERKGFKYIAINAGYWIICLAIMGGIVSGWM